MNKVINAQQVQKFSRVFSLDFFGSFASRQKNKHLKFEIHSFYRRAKKNLLPKKRNRFQNVFFVVVILYSWLSRFYHLLCNTFSVRCCLFLHIQVRQNLPLPENYLLVFEIPNHSNLVCCLKI